MDLTATDYFIAIALSFTAGVMTTILVLLNLVLTQREKEGHITLGSKGR